MFALFDLNICGFSTACVVLRDARSGVAFRCREFDLTFDEN